MSISDDVAHQYTKLSAHYDDWFSVPWPAPARIQGQALDRILKAHNLPSRSRILDLTCGIGTQAIGLAMQGHDVVALDISQGQLDKAKMEADKIDPALSVKWVLGDATSPQNTVEGQFDAVISFGNSLPLLGAEQAINAAMLEAYRLLKSEGLLLVSMRDHADLRARRPYLMGSGKLNNGARQGVWIETGEWLEGENRYKSHIIFVMSEPAHEEHHYPFPPLVAITRTEFINVLQNAGWHDIHFFERTAHPEFSCPLYIARK